MENDDMPYAAQQDGPPFRVLVIDDDPDAVLVIDHILTRGQLVVTSVSGPGEAIDLLAKTSFDVVVTDVWMPGMTGLELLHLLDLTSPDLPVVIVTADVGVDSALGVLRSRAAGFLFKPLEPRQLLQTVTELARAARMLKASPQPASRPAA